MKLLKKMLSAVILAGAMAIPAISSAAVIVDVFNPHPDVEITSYNSPYTYTHNLLTHGYVPGTPITSGTIDIVLKDDLDLLGSETVSFFFDNLFSGSVSHVPPSIFGSPSTYAFSLTTSLLTDGLLNISLSVGCNGSIFGHCIFPQDVIFAKSTLTADVSEVPEPATLGILGFGLLGLAGARRRRK